VGSGGLIFEGESEGYLLRNGPAGGPVLKKLKEDPEKRQKNPCTQPFGFRITTEIKAIQQIYVILYRYILNQKQPLTVIHPMLREKSDFLW
jgi:hypothetical protein